MQPREILRAGVNRISSTLAMNHRVAGAHTFRVLSGPNAWRVVHTTNPDQSFAGGWYEAAVTQALSTRLRPGDVFYDIGANVGWFTLLAAPRVGARGRVFAFEPGEVSRSLLERNVLENGLLNVRVIPYAVGARRERHRFANYREYGLVNHIISQDLPAAHDAAITEVTAISIDEFMDEGHPPPNAIKIDVEGFEVAVLEGARRALLQFRPLVVCEVRRQTSDRICELMTAFGYRWRDLGGRGRGLDAAGVSDLIFVPARGEPGPVAG